MFITIHSAAGIIIGKYTSNFILAFLAGIFSHFFLDAIPHGDENLIDDKDAFRDNFNLSKKQKIQFFLIAASDFVLASLIIIWLYSAGRIQLTLPLGGAVLGSILPDILFGTFLITRLNLLRILNKPHVWFHSLIRNNVTLIQGLIIQFIFWLILLAIICLA